MRMDGLEQVVLTAADPEATVRFYVQTLGLLVSNFTDGGTVLHCGGQKLVVRRAEAIPGQQGTCRTAVTLSFGTQLPMPIVTGHLAVRGVPLAAGPSRLGDGREAVSIHDPDGRLVEVVCPAGDA